MKQRLAIGNLGLTWETLLPSVVLALLCLLLQIWPGMEILRYERSLLAEQPWRIVTGHFVHLDYIHLLLNLLGVTLVRILFADVLPNRLSILIAACSALGITAGLYLLNPEVEWYVGLSGILYGYCAGGALYGMVKVPYRRRFYALLLLVIFLKLLWEQWSGGSWSDVLFNSAVVTHAHLYGVICNLLIVTPVLLYRCVGSGRQA
jgi:rhomboid family GlyGly-CTERM serine protease